MESAPQSTINHKAVIEFASDSWMSHPRPVHVMRRALHIEVRPAQKGCLELAGTLPKSPSPRNAERPKKGLWDWIFSRKNIVPEPSPRNGCKSVAKAEFRGRPRPENAAYPVRP